MEIESRKNRRRLWIFALYLILGAAGFAAASSCLRVPVYQVVEGTVSGECDVLCGEAPPAAEEGEPLFLYVARDETARKIGEYRIEGNRITFAESAGFPAGTAVRVEIPVGKVTVLWAVFRKGGAL